MPKYEVYVGEPSPQQAAIMATGRRFEARASGNLSAENPHPLSTTELWTDLLLEPRWSAQDTSRCVAALNPSVGSDEMKRMVGGATRREEITIVIAEMPAPPLVVQLRGGTNEILLSDGWSLQGQRLPAGVSVHIPDDLSPFEADLAGRIRSTHDREAPWFSMVSTKPRPNPQMILPRPSPITSALRPLLQDDLGGVLAGVLTHTKFNQVWFAIPPGCKWKSLLGWLVDRGIPELISTAARRVGLAAYVPETFRTPEERAAREALEQFEADASRRRQELVEALEKVTAEANEMRLPLLEGEGHALKKAVGKVFVEAGFAVEDLDETMGEGDSADLLLTLKGKHWLIEVKSAKGVPKQQEVSALLRDLRQWKHSKRTEEIEHGVLVVNSESSKPADARRDGPYDDPTFVASLDVGVVSTTLLYRWWRDGDFDRIGRAVTDPPCQRSP